MKDWTIGVVSDTHIPDRARRLNPRLLKIFRQAEVQAILHAGDLCNRHVLQTLGEIAPTYAVRGNRDWLMYHQLPVRQSLQFGSLRVVLAHGHGSLLNYLLDKVHYLASGLDQKRFEERLVRAHPEADVLVFGHTHIPVNHRHGKTLLFNPGSACCPHYQQLAPSAGLLHIHNQGQVEGEIISLDG